MNNEMPNGEGRPQSLHVKEAAGYIRSLLPAKYATPAVGIVCGSGLSNLAVRMTEVVDIPYADIPHFPRATVPGHGTRMLVGMLNGIVTACLLGRFHFYEGHDVQRTVLPIRVLARLGVRTVLLTNAAGALDATLNVGDIMWIEDHISFLNLAGVNPLRGENLGEFGPRFPSMTDAHDTRGYGMLHDAAKEAGIGATVIRKGVYVMIGGPSYETRAEVRMLRTLGGHAVGMSTIPEVVAAVHSGLKVVAFSLITNIAVGGEGVGPSHEEVLEATTASAGRLESLVYYLAPRLAALADQG